MKRRDFVKYTAAGLLAGPTLVSARGTGGVRRLRLELRPEQRHWFAPVAAPLELWGSDRELLRLHQHESVEIEVVNRLPDATSLHWHGMRIDNAMDGVSGITQEPIPPGGRFVYRLTPADAGTFWVHAHHKSYEQLARGLYLPLIVEEERGTAWTGNSCWYSMTGASARTVNSISPRWGTCTTGLTVVGWATSSASIVNSGRRWSPGPASGCD